MEPNENFYPRLLETQGILSIIRKGELQLKKIAYSTAF
jgi:hypothetical protein